MNPPSTPDPSLERWQEIEAVLDLLLDAEPSRWPVLLDGACGGDVDLRREVEDLLRHHEPSRDFLGAPAAELATEIMTEGGDPAQRVPSFEGRRIGPYRVVREIGRGGMGRVFLAERADGQFEQRVALKLLRPGLDNPESELRFASERRILASLEHPAIARLLDGGVTPEGLSWLAMEYVEGRPIHGYCEARKLSVRQRLELFLALTSAVQYAHRNLVVHRDLKPSNIQIDADGELKLLDFGIAKLLSGGEGDAVPLTRPGQRFLTPEYSAPEQVRGEPVTTATDVYQLGVVLYELLAGRRPFEGKGTSLHELEVAILEREPERPSTAVSGPGHRATSPMATLPGGVTVDRGRSPSPDRLRRTLTGDLDAIVLKALRKDPELRYASAGEMGEDIRRYLAGLPVLAHEGSRAYRVRKFARRHRWGLAAAGLVAASLVLGTGAAVWQAAAAARERDRTRQALEASEQVSDFLIGLFEAGDPRRGGSDAVTTLELLRLGAARVEELGDAPLLQARALDAMGRVYMNLGRYEEAAPLLERALEVRRAEHGEEHAEVAQSLAALGRLAYRRGRFGEAEALYDRALSMQRRFFGDMHPTVAATLFDFAAVTARHLARAEAMLREALHIRSGALGADHPSVAEVLETLGPVVWRRGQHEEAERILREAVRLRRRGLGPDHPEVARGMFHLADVVRHRPDRQAEAEAIYRRGLTILRGQPDVPHSVLIHALHGLAALVGSRGAHAEAEELLREALAVQRRVYGAESRGVAETTGHLAAHRVRQGRLEKAEELRRREIELWERSVGPEHSATAGAMSELSHVLALRGRHDEAEEMQRRTVAIREATFGPDAVMVGIGLAMLGDVLRDSGDLAAAEPLLHRALAIISRHRGERDVNTRATHDRLATLYKAWGRPADAARHRALAGPSPRPNWPMLP